MCSMTFCLTFPIPISFPPSPIPIVVIFSDVWAENNKKMSIKRDNEEKESQNCLPWLCIDDANNPLAMQIMPRVTLQLPKCVHIP